MQKKNFHQSFSENLENPQEVTFFKKLLKRKIMMKTCRQWSFWVQICRYNNLIFGKNNFFFYFRTLNEFCNFKNWVELLEFPPHHFEFDVISQLLWPRHLQIYKKKKVKLSLPHWIPNTHCLLPLRSEELKIVTEFETKTLEHLHFLFPFSYLAHVR